MKVKFHNFSIEYIPIDLNQFKGLKGYRNNFLDCYSRLLIPELKSNLDKVIYLDFDVMLFDDIVKLWHQTFDGFELCACVDLGYSSKIEERCLKIGATKNQAYCNAGVLLIDCAQWRKNKVSQKLMSLAKDIKDNILYICEDLLNIYYKNNNYKILDLRFNSRQMPNTIGSFCCPNITNEYIFQEWKNIVILHWTVKPWNSMQIGGETLKYTGLFWFFAKMTPFYEGLSKKFLSQCNIGKFDALSKKILDNNLSIANFIKKNETNENKLAVKNSSKTIKLFNLIPILNMKEKGNTKKYAFLYIIPLLKIKFVNNVKKYTILGFIPFLKIK